MQVGDRIGNLEVTHITYRQRKDGSQGAPLLVDVRCKCGVEKTVRASVLTAKRPQQSCGGKGCKKKGPPLPKPAKLETEVWYCTRRGTV
jgi:hypothetical protein